MYKQRLQRSSETKGGVQNVQTVTKERRSGPKLTSSDIISIRPRVKIENGRITVDRGFIREGDVEGQPRCLAVVIPPCGKIVRSSPSVEPLAAEAFTASEETLRAAAEAVSTSCIGTEKFQREHLMRRPESERPRFLRACGLLVLADQRRKLKDEIGLDCDKSATDSTYDWHNVVCVTDGNSMFSDARDLVLLVDANHTASTVMLAAVYAIPMMRNRVGEIHQMIGIRKSTHAMTNKLLRGTLGILMYVVRWILASSVHDANAQLRVLPYRAIGGMSHMTTKLSNGTPTQKRLAAAMRGEPTSAAELGPCVRDVLERHPLRVVAPSASRGMAFAEVRNPMLETY